MSAAKASAYVEKDLGAVVTFKRGYDLPHAERRAGDVPVISSSGVTGSHDVAKASGPGVITGRYGTLGEVHYVEGDYWPLNTALYVLDFHGNHPRYVAYLLRTLGLGQQNTAGAVPGVNRNVLHRLRVRVPDPKTQERIADVLGTYDALITNGERRMALLEKSVHLLYHEWFERLRFPGHEWTQMENGIPAGWQRSTLGHFAPLAYGDALPERIRVPGTVPVFGSSGIVGQHNVPCVDGPGIVVGRKGNVGAVHWSSGSFWPIDTVFYIGPDRASHYLRRALNSMSFTNSDSAVPGLNRNAAHAQPLLLPPEHVLSEFERRADEVQRFIDTLDRQNAKLREARDYLLPRLMSGQLTA